jgi:hypothetical protein
MPKRRKTYKVEELQRVLGELIRDHAGNAELAQGHAELEARPEISSSFRALEVTFQSAADALFEFANRLDIELPWYLTDTTEAATEARVRSPFGEVK